MSKWPDRMIMLAAGIAICAIVVVLAMRLLSDKITLPKAEWECTASHTESHPGWPGPSFLTLCDRYERKAQ